MTQAIDQDTVIQYLLDNPDFFQKNAGILPEMHLTSPILGKTVSLHERQMEVMRGKYKTLELQLSKLMHTAQDNKALAEKMLDWTQALLKEKNDVDMPQTLVMSLKSAFAVPDVTLRLWNVREEYSMAWFTQSVTEDIRNAVNTLKTPYCGKSDNIEALTWFTNMAAIRSTALIPIRENTGSEAFGLLILGSPDKARFQEEMATDFLTDIGKMASAALGRLLTIG